jgi:hypothetical protein
MATRPVAAGSGPPAEDLVDPVPRETVEHQVDHGPVGELGTAERTAKVPQRRTAEPLGLESVSAGGGEGVPRPARAIVLIVLGGIEQMGESAEGTPGRCQRLYVRLDPGEARHGRGEAAQSGGEGIDGVAVAGD